MAGTGAFYPMAAHQLIGMWEAFAELEAIG
jgi:hypothetical protein